MHNKGETIINIRGKNFKLGGQLAWVPGVGTSLDGTGTKEEPLWLAFSGWQGEWHEIKLDRWVGSDTPGADSQPRHYWHWGWIILCHGAESCALLMLSSTPGLHPLDTSTRYSSSCDSPNCSRMSPAGSTRSPWVENHPKLGLQPARSMCFILGSMERYWAF